ncbi:MAG TPA: hypothetical protein GX697_04175 [Firmicutes bacterium]|nr:hypothetical protein [Bacillota bacterium]
MVELDYNSIKECENLILQVRGVVSTQIVKGNSGEISEIHVLADSSRSAKQVVRDIESAVLVQLGIELDHKKISVAQLQAGEEEPSPIRPRLESIEITVKGTMAEANISINFDTITHQGKAKGANVSRNRLRLAAIATLNAVESYLGGTVSFMLEDVQKINFSGREVVLVGISLITPVGEETLLGAALVARDERESAVKAALDALNRRLILLKKE